MGLVEQWRRIRSELEPDWGEVALNVAVPQAEQRAQAASLLGPAGPGRRGDDLRLSVHRAGGGIGPDQADKLFRKLDEARIRGTVTLVSNTTLWPITYCYFQGQADRTRQLSLSDLRGRTDRFPPIRSIP